MDEKKRIKRRTYRENLRERQAYGAMECRCLNEITFVKKRKRKTGQDPKRPVFYGCFCITEQFFLDETRNNRYTMHITEIRMENVPEQRKHTKTVLKICVCTGGEERETDESERVAGM